MNAKTMPRFIYLGELEKVDVVVATTIKLRCQKCSHEWVATVRNGYLAEYDLECKECKNNFREQHWEIARDR